jgi:L-asparaginase II
MSQPLTVDGCVELANIDRNGLIESRHIGAFVVIDREGSVIESGGDIDATIFPRSTLKPMQAVATLRAGAELEGVELVLASASHCGSKRHTDAVRGMLAHDDLGPDDLGCPPAWPLGTEEKAELIAHGEGKRRITMNCSGKHAAFLRACVKNGWDTKTYLDPTHPLQVLIRETIEEFTGSKELWSAVDGCGAPLYGMSLRALGTGIARITEGHDENATRLVEAIQENAWALDGVGRDNTRVIEGTGCIAKIGAEGVLIIAKDGIAAALKCLDGSDRANTAVALALLARHSVIDVAVAENLTTELVEQITGGDAVVGRLTVAV